MTITVFLADDHAVVRDGLRFMLQAQPDIRVIGDAANGRDAVRQMAELRPDVVVMDIAMSDLNGIEATRQIMEEAPGVKVIGLSMHSDRRFVEGMLGAGASGYLLKDAAFEDLADAIRTVMAGRVYLCAEIAGIVVEGFVKGGGGGAPSPLDMLTRREREVLQLLAEGKRTKQIASELGVSVKTVESHRSRLMNKLGTHSVAELTKYAIREGLTSL